MGYNIKTVRDVLVVNFSSSRDTSQNSDEIIEALKSYINNGTEKILFNLSALEFVNSVIIGIFVFVIKKLKKVNSFSLIGINSASKLALERTKLLKFFKVFETMEEALNYLNSNETKNLAAGDL